MIPATRRALPIDSPSLVVVRGGPRGCTLPRVPAGASALKRRRGPAIGQRIDQGSLLARRRPRRRVPLVPMRDPCRVHPASRDRCNRSDSDGVAAYIAIADASRGAPVCLAGGGGCETVASSSYSHLLGINVADFGIVGYILILGTALIAGDLGRFGGFALSLVGFGFSVYLTYLELFKIHAICQWCVGSAVLMTALFALNATRLIGYGGIEERIAHRSRRVRQPQPNRRMHDQQTGAGEKRRLRAHRLEREAADAKLNARRRRLVQAGSAAVFLAVVIVAVLIVVSENKNHGVFQSLRNRHGRQAAERHPAGRHDARRSKGQGDGL